MVRDSRTEDALRHVYNFKCQRCRYSRHCGHGKLTAETLATSHALRLAHKVIVWKSDLQRLTSEVHLVVDPEREPNLLDQPPF